MEEEPRTGHESSSLAQPWTVSWSAEQEEMGLAPQLGAGPPAAQARIP